MDCSEYLERFSELEDGLADPASCEAAEAHLGSCPGCRRYRDVFRKGVDLLRSFESPRVRGDFKPRLQHRIYHLEDASVLEPSGASGATVLTTVGMATLLTLVAWSPSLRSGAVEVAEVEADPVSARPAHLATGPVFEPATPLKTRAAGRSLLLEYSAFGPARASGPVLRRVGTGLD